MKNVVHDFNISTPPDLKYFTSCLGWCGKAVDSLADRLMFRGFAEDNFDINGIFAMNNPDILYDSAILGALIGSCDFIYIVPDKDGFPKMQVIDGSNATGVIDVTTGLLKEGYVVLETNEYGKPKVEAYLVPYKIVIISDNKVTTYEHNVPHPLLVPIVYRPDAKRPFGHSRITRACMSIVGSALRTVKRSEIAAEFFSFPQKYVNGLSEDAEIADKWKATMSAMMAFSKDEDGDKPVVGQFQAQSMTPHLEQVKMFASLFAGETGLTLDDLGFTSGNPSSSEAIKAAHENLRLTATKAQKTFGSGFLNAGYLAACLRDGKAYNRSQFYLTTPKWEPLFNLDASQLSGIGDAIIKIQQSYPDYFNEDKLKDLTGI